MNGFITKVDISDNRQVKQYERTETQLSGSTKFGLPFSALTNGPDTTNEHEYTIYEVTSVFSGNTGTTNFTFGAVWMELAEPYISAITNLNSGVTQNLGPIYVGFDSTVIDGNTVYLNYTGISYPLQVTAITETAPGVFTGRCRSEYVTYYTAGSLDYTGRTIWVDVSGITRTERLIVTNNPQVGYVLTCADAEGMADWSPISAVTSGTTFWSGGSGTYAVVLKYSNSSSSGKLSVSEGSGNTASGAYSHAEGGINLATGLASHVEGGYNSAIGDVSHVEGLYNSGMGSGVHVEGSTNKGIGNYSHAEGYKTTSYANFSHSEGDTTIASGLSSHAEGYKTTSYGNYSHSEGNSTIASGLSSHAEGVSTKAIGINSHAEGSSTTAIGNNSHAEGYETLANGTYSHAEGYQTVGNGFGSHIGGYSDDKGGLIAEGVASFIHSYSIKGNISKASGNYSAILGGQNNNIQSGAASSAIIGGYNNLIIDTAQRSVILGGNSITADTSDTIFGQNMTLFGDLHVCGSTSVFATEVILAEDNNIILNYNGSHASAIGGGFIIEKGKLDNSNIIISSTTTGDVSFNTGIIINGDNGFSQLRLMQNYTPTDSKDDNGDVGCIAWDDNYLYIKVNTGWKRTALIEW